MLRNLDHRGACGCEANTGDGAGILMQIPHRFFQKVAAKRRFQLPEPGRLRRRHDLLLARPRDARGQPPGVRADRSAAKARRSSAGATCRSIPAPLGAHRAGQQAVRAPGVHRPQRRLHRARRSSSASSTSSASAPTTRSAAATSTTIGTSAACRRRTLVYKGMLMPEQVDVVYPDLRDPDMESALALVHSRFSTNTFPSWERAHPYRYLAHNGEINTLRGNVNWMQRPPGAVQERPVRPRAREDLPDHPRERQRLADVRQLPRVPGPGRPQAGPRDDDDDPRAVGTPRVDGSGAPRVLPIPRSRSWNRGTARPRWPSPTACASARASTATACARRATTSPRTTA